MEEEFRKIREILEDHEKRIRALERTDSKKKGKKMDEFKKYEGLMGGIRFLIDKDFLNVPRSVDEIFGELKKEGYHYPKKSVSKILSVDFFKKEKTLTRIKGDGVWKYAVRK